MITNKEYYKDLQFAYDTGYRIALKEDRLVLLSRAAALLKDTKKGFKDLKLIVEVFDLTEEEVYKIFGPDALRC